MTEFPLLRSKTYGYLTDEDLNKKATGKKVCFKKKI